MEQRLLCAVTAAARARAFIQRPLPDDRELEPPHPAFVAFRRMSYIWMEGDALHPVGDRLRLWIEFMRDQGVTDVWLTVREQEAAVRTAGAMSAIWRVAEPEEDGSVRMHGEVARPGGRPETDEADVARDLRDAIASATLRPDVLRPVELARALAILDSRDDGRETSDVAWPYFVLPDPLYGASARRLLAAAVTAWPPPTAMENTAEGHWRHSLLACAGLAAMAAVNSLRPGEALQ